MSDTPIVPNPNPTPTTPSQPAPPVVPIQAQVQVPQAAQTAVATAPTTGSTPEAVAKQAEITELPKTATEEDAVKSKTKFVYSPLERKQFGAYALLSEVVRQVGGLVLPVAPTKGEDKAIADLVDFLFLENLIEINGLNYRVTDKGYQKAKVFNDRYNTMVFTYGAFRFYDTANDEFAHDSFLDYFQDPVAWEEFTYQTYPKNNLAEPDELRFRNILVAVFQYENYLRILANQPQLHNVKEAMFYLVLGEQYFTKDFENKDFALNLGTGCIFDEIEENLNSQLQLVQFQVQLVKNKISPKAFFESVIERGRNLVDKCSREADAILQEQSAAVADQGGVVGGQEEEVVTTTTTASYYDDLGYDPWAYPLWATPLYFEPVVYIDYW